ncbi:hypothetical protein ACIQTW_05850 [Paenarthrobacter sp. NPDC090517]|uniref:hypothetical protein n=1 Tax=Paenarthrobacter sp. NPDC090517 TaxID=3364381 RepID=UPI0038007F07
MEPSGPEESYPLDCLVEPRDSDVLIVALHGALNREVYTLPRFEWMATLQERPESLLFLSDTPLESHDDLKLAWYTGDSDDNLTERYGALVRSVAVQCGASRIVLLGFSGGGFAALAMAPLIAGSVALAFSPQVSIGRYYGVFAEAYSTALYPEYRSFEGVEAAYPRRVSLTTLYSDPQVSANFVYVQNSGDTHHMQHHFSPFREVTADRPGAHFILDHESDSHSAPSKERVNQMLDECLTLRIPR